MSKTWVDCAAFPIPLDDRPGAYPAEPGMGLRDYFAAQAIEGLAATLAGPRHLSREDMQVMATNAYRLADAMMEARLK